MLEFINSINPIFLIGFFSMVIFISIGYQGIKEIKRQKRGSKN